MSSLALKAELVSLLEEKKRRADRRRLTSYRPYAKQRQFHAEGAEHRERLLMAGNQLGKTFCGAAEAAIHLTGQYPGWWQGRRWDRPVRAWAGSKTGEVTRDGVQRYLIGEPKDEGQWGTGMIPGDSLMDWSRRQGVPDALDSAIVRHASGGTSTLGFKSYDQGRQKWQSETLDFVWFDEEPPMDIYMEGLTRTNATGGSAFITFTPLLGMSDVVAMFLGETV
jgi:phage terminase large subunit-like protein